MFENWYAPSDVLKKLNGNTSNGLYAIQLKTKNAFALYNPAFHEKYLNRREPKEIIYIGKACGANGIWGRLQNELRQEGRGTFFRSVGAVLKFCPKNHQVGGDILNYTFACREKTAILEFMEKNFIISCRAMEDVGEIEAKEKDLIYNSFNPVINIQKNPNWSHIVKLERERCRRIAQSRDEDNRFVLLLREAHDKGWCTKPLCTTCGCMDYRKAINDMGLNTLLEEMMAIDTECLLRQSNWQNGTKTAMLLLSEEQNRRLRLHWPNIL